MGSDQSSCKRIGTSSSHSHKTDANPGIRTRSTSAVTPKLVARQAAEIKASRLREATVRAAAHQRSNELSPSDSYIAVRMLICEAAKRDVARYRPHGASAARQLTCEWAGVLESCSASFVDTFGRHVNAVDEVLPVISNMYIWSSSPVRQFIPSKGLSGSGALLDEVLQQRLMRMAGVLNSLPTDSFFMPPECVPAVASPLLPLQPLPPPQQAPPLQHPCPTGKRPRNAIPAVVLPRSGGTEESQGTKRQTYASPLKIVQPPCPVDWQVPSMICPMSIVVP